MGYTIFCRLMKPDIADAARPLRRVQLERRTLWYHSFASPLRRQPVNLLLQHILFWYRCRKQACPSDRFDTKEYRIKWNDKIGVREEYLSYPTAIGRTSSSTCTCRKVVANPITYGLAVYLCAGGAGGFASRGRIRWHGSMPAAMWQQV